MISFSSHLLFKPWNTKKHHVLDELRLGVGARPHCKQYNAVCIEYLYTKD